MNFFTKLGGFLFGGKSDKGLVEQAADAVERFKPGATKLHEMSIEDQKAGDESQASARSMVLVTGGTNWFDRIVDGTSRIVRPLVTLWVICVLFGWVEIPLEQWSKIPDMMWNIIWSVITYWFGARMLFKDLPTALVNWRNK